MSLLPQTIIPQTNPIGQADATGRVIIDKNWWLFLYNISQSVLGNGQGLTPDALLTLEGADGDALDADAIALRAPVAALYAQLPGEPDPVPYSAIRNALILAQDTLLPDPVPQAQPAAAITVGASPFTFTAPANGQLLIVGGTVSSIALVRQGASNATGMVAGFFPVSRRDAVVITYSGTPTVTFLPT